MKYTLHILLGLALFGLSACATTYTVQMGVVTSFSFTNNSTCRDILNDLGRPHQQILGKGLVTWRYAYSIRSDKPKDVKYQHYTFVLRKGRIKKFINKVKPYNFVGKGFRTQPVCPIQ